MLKGSHLPASGAQVAHADVGVAVFQTLFFRNERRPKPPARQQCIRAWNICFPSLKAVSVEQNLKPRSGKSCPAPPVLHCMLLWSLPALTQRLYGAFVLSRAFWVYGFKVVFLDGVHKGLYWVLKGFGGFLNSGMFVLHKA